MLLALTGGRTGSRAATESVHKLTSRLLALVASAYLVEAMLSDGPILVALWATFWGVVLALGTPSLALAAWNRPREPTGDNRCMGYHQPSS